MAVVLDPGQKEQVGLISPYTLRRSPSRMEMVHLDPPGILFLIVTVKMVTPGREELFKVEKRSSFSS